MQWTSSFGNTGSWWTRGGSPVAFVSTPLIFFLWNLWKWTGKISYNSLRTKITCFFLGGWPFTTSFAIIYHPEWHQRRNRNQAKVLMVRNCTSVWDAIRSTSGACLPCLSGRMRRDGNETPALVKDRLTLAREGSLVGRPVSTLSIARRKASNGKQPWHWARLFSLLQMRLSGSRTTPFELYLENIG